MLTINYKKKFNLLLAVLIVCALIGSAQAQAFIYFGGSARDEGKAIAVAGDYVYIVGNTFSRYIPLSLINAPGDGSNSDVFVAKFNRNLELLATTYLGGSSYDVSYALATSNDGNDIYIVGATKSIEFPCTNTTGGCDVNYSDNDKNSTRAYVVKLDSSLKFTAATYVGANSSWAGISNKWGTAKAIAISDNSDIYVAGTTKVIVEPNSDTPYVEKAYVAKLNSNLNLLADAVVNLEDNNINSYDDITSIALSKNDVYIAGTSYANYPNPGDTFVGILDNDFELISSKFVNSDSLGSNTYITAFGDDVYLSYDKLNGTYSYIAKLGDSLNEVVGTYLEGGVNDMLISDGYIYTVASTIYDTYAAKLDSNLYLLDYAHFSDGLVDCYPDGIVISGSDVYIAGVADDSAFAAKLSFKL